MATKIDLQRRWTESNAEVGHWIGVQYRDDRGALCLGHVRFGKGLTIGYISCLVHWLIITVTSMIRIMSVKIEILQCCFDTVSMYNVHYKLYPDIVCWYLLSVVCDVCHIQPAIPRDTVVRQQKEFDEERGNRPSSPGWWTAHHVLTHQSPVAWAQVDQATPASMQQFHYILGLCFTRGQVGYLHSSDNTQALIFFWGHEKIIVDKSNKDTARQTKGDSCITEVLCEVS